MHAFRNGDIDIFVGTQMIAKGHDIPNVTLVGVVLADMASPCPIFAPRSEVFNSSHKPPAVPVAAILPVQVVIQTLNPDHYAIPFAAEQDYEGFYEKGLEFRKWLRYPPFAVIANVMVRSEKQEDALRFSTELERMLKPAPEGVKVLGPAEAPVAKLKAEYRYQLLLKASKRTVLGALLKQLREYALRNDWPATTLVIDVDPLSLM